MKRPDPQEVSERMAERLHAAQSPWERRRLNARVALRRLAWRVVIGGAFALKRFLDIVISLACLILFAPLFLLLALLVKLDGGPVFFAQTRVGFRGAEFKMLKYRSMVVNAEAKLQELLAQNEKVGGVTFKMKNDPRVTKVGRFLRKSSLDELPQFLNVLRGEMSVVGPRPAVPREVEQYSQADRRRLLAKPGITCIWQVGEREGRVFEIGDRNAIGFDEQVELDVRYIETHSFARDLWLMLKTVPAIVFGKGM